MKRPGKWKAWFPWVNWFNLESHLKWTLECFFNVTFYKVLKTLLVLFGQNSPCLQESEEKESRKLHKHRCTNCTNRGTSDVQITLSVSAPRKSLPVPTNVCKGPTRSVHKQPRRQRAHVWTRAYANTRSSKNRTACTSSVCVSSTKTDPWENRAACGVWAPGTHWKDTRVSELTGNDGKCFGSPLPWKTRQQT